VFPELVADRIARKLDLDVDDIGICHACLSFVSFAAAAREWTWVSASTTNGEERRGRARPRRW
jgi:hypothetical protein